MSKKQDQLNREREAHADLDAQSIDFEQWKDALDYVAKVTDGIEGFCNQVDYDWLEQSYDDDVFTPNQAYETHLNLHDD